MGDRMFTRGSTPFANREALSDAYTPDELVGRDDEVEDFAGALEPVIHGEQPKNIFLYGKTGVGKTATTRYLLNQLQEDAAVYDDVDVEVIEVNCEGLHTSYSVSVRIVNTLLEPEDSIPESGLSTSRVYQRMWRELDTLGSQVLLVLDEIDHVDSEEDGFLYQLSRARENNNLEDTRIGLIGISNDLSFSDRLSPKVRSSLCERQINFPTYDVDELRDVLQQRAELAFKDDALDAGVIELCAAYGRRQGGDARKALDLLREAGDLAREDDRNYVTEDDVEASQSEVERQEIAEGIEDLHEHDRYLLYAMCTLDAAAETPVRTKEIYPRYKQICQMAATEELTSRSAHDHLSDLSMLGFLSYTEKNLGPSGGSYREYSLAQDLTLVVEGLEGTIRTAGILEEIEDLTGVTESDVEGDEVGADLDVE